MDSTPNQIDVLVGRNVSGLRVQRGFTLAFVASKLGVGSEALIAREAGQQRFGALDLHTLCHLLDVRPQALYKHVLVDAAY